MQEVKPILTNAEDSMEATLLFLDESLAHIRAGKANTRILDGVKVEYYGSHVPLTNVATVTTPDAKTITIQPWEKGLIGIIEKAILNSDIGITPMNNGEVIRLGIPPLTEEQLKKLEKNGLPEDMEKDAEANVQKIHDKYIKKIDDMLLAKEKEIMTV
jgi:ribosome recycling factor